jgi:prepilin-type N-terminal cleavage/methylation domain-containing protein
MTTRIARRGFTALELMVVLGIMLTLAGVALPATLPALRRARVTDAASDIASCWSQARVLAMSRRPSSDGALAGRHYGMIIVQRAGQPTWAGVIYAKDDLATLAGDPEAALLRPDPAAAPDAGSNRPTVRKIFAASAVVASGTSASMGSGDQVLAIYAQYGTGMPIAPADVAAGQGFRAAPSALGMPQAEGDPRPALVEALRIQTADYREAPRHGAATRVAICHVGVTLLEDL